MKQLQTLMARCLVLALAVCLATFVPATYAVVKDLSIVDGEGKSLANTKVTIVFPDGTEVDEETDDDGMLYYDFPKDGEYTVRYPGGQMAVNVGGGGGGGLSTGQMIGAGAAAVAIIGIGVVASDSGRKSESSSSSSSSSDPGGSSGSSGGTTSDEACQGDTFNFIGGLMTSVSSNPGNHPNNFDGDWEIFCDPGVEPRVLYVGSNQLNVSWNCTAGTSADCVATTDCSYQGISTVCQLDSSFFATPPEWNGSMTAGSDGNLPGGQPITVNFSTPL
ncbi:MAG: hypothetical protein ACR2QV_04335 [Gammaproteobacteria bacterium]